MSRRVQTIIALMTFFVAIFSRELFRELPPEWSGRAWKSSWVLFALLGLAIAHRMAPREALSELGLNGSFSRGMGFAFVGTLPMFVILAIAGGQAPRFDARSLLDGAVLAALTEEILFRGYLFLQLHRRAGLALPWAVLVTGLLFGLAHIGTVIRQGPSAVLGVVAITTLGGMYFAWLLVRWRNNLWVPIGVHTFMNASWELFAGADNAVGDLWANIARVAAITLTIVLTLRFAPNAAPEVAK